MTQDQVQDIESMAKACLVETPNNYQLRRDDVPVFTIPKNEHSYRNLLIYASRYQFYLQIHNEIELLCAR